MTSLTKERIVALLFALVDLDSQSYMSCLRLQMKNRYETWMKDVEAVVIFDEVIKYEEPAVRMTIVFEVEAKALVTVQEP